MTNDETKFDLKRGLNAWVEQNITLSDFATAMGWKYQNAWGVVRGKNPVTVDTVGRFALAFGPAALSEFLTLAGLTETMEVSFAGSVPVAESTNSREPVYTQPEQAA
jgi:hypothetical protein